VGKHRLTMSFTRGTVAFGELFIVSVNLSWQLFFLSIGYILVFHGGEMFYRR
jgi:hypothetical protein